MLNSLNPFERSWTHRPLQNGVPPTSCPFSRHKSPAICAAGPLLFPFSSSIYHISLSLYLRPRHIYQYIIPCAALHRTPVAVQPARSRDTDSLSTVEVLHNRIDRDFETIFIQPTVSLALLFIFHQDNPDTAFIHHGVGTQNRPE